MSILATTQIYGIFGHPVSHSLSPVMHNSAFSKLNLNCIYVAFDIDPVDISNAVQSIRSLGIKGINITVPHKQAVIPFLDEVSEEAKLIGAVNTIKNIDGKLYGFNTDVKGVLRAMKEEVGYDPVGTTALLIGAGGASRAVLCGLCQNGVNKVYIANRTYENAEKLSSEFQKNFREINIQPIKLDETSSLSDAIIQCDILINSSSAGMDGVDSLNIPLELLPKESVVYDLVYNPAITKLVNQARSLGIEAQNGLGMLLYQGVEAFEIWTDLDAPVEIMREALLNN